MNVFEKVIKDIEGFFESGKAKKALEEATALVPKALPIVQDLEAITPNKTVAEVAAAYTKYAVPMASELADNPTAIGNGLLNLATTLLAKEVGPAAANILQTAVQIGVTAINAK